MKKNDTGFFGSNTTLLLAIALVLTGGTLFFSAFNQQPSGTGSAGSRPAVVQDASAILTSGVGSATGYTDGLITSAQARIKENASDIGAFSELGLAYLQKARETNDPSLYTQAESSLQSALKLNGDHYDALAGMGSLSLSRHEFAEARDWGEKAVQINPDKAYGYGIVGDAQTGLGDYAEAVETIQNMINLRPDLASYSRMSYLRELHGDVPGAIEGMRQAVKAGSPAAENTAWGRVQIGNLLFNSGDLSGAEKEYGDALAGYPNYLHAQAGLAQVRWAQGRVDEATNLYKQAVSSVPLPQYVSMLGDLYASTGNSAAAKEQYDLVSYIFKVWETGGVDVEIEKALFLADHGLQPAEALQMAEKGAAKRNDVYTLDTLAWARYRAGKFAEAEEAMKSAMRLGTKNPNFYFRMGMIQAALGKNDEARSNLRQALELNPHFSILYSKEAAATLTKLGR